MIQYLLTEDEETRAQVVAAIAEAEGLGEVLAVGSLDRLYESLVSSDSACVLVDESLADVSALVAIQEISHLYPLFPVILLTRSRNAETLTAAMDSGARTVLTLPLSLEDLESRLQSVLAWARAAQGEASVRNDPGRKPGMVTAIVGAKGGVGTSTVALMAAAQLARRARTCLVDLDVRGGDLAAMANLSVRHSITDLVDIAAEVSAREISEVTYPLPGGIVLLPAPDHGEAGEAMTEATTRQIISMLRYQFDYVILDCGSRLDDIQAMALDSADQMFVVATPDAPAVRSVRRLIEALNRLDIARGNPIGLIVNRSDRHREIQPRTAAKMAFVPLAVSIPDLTSQIEMATNSATLLTAKVPNLAKSARAVAKSILAEGTKSSPKLSPTVFDEKKRAVPYRRPGGHWRQSSEKGQVTVEFPVVFALATAALLLCIQLLGYGISYMLANNSAEEAAHAYGVGMTSNEVRHEVAGRLPGAYRSDMTITQNSADEVTVTLPVPSVVDLHTSATSGVVWEFRK